MEQTHRHSLLSASGLELRNQHYIAVVDGRAIVHNRQSPTIFLWLPLLTL